MTTSSQTPEVSCVLLCKGENAKSIANLVSCIHTTNSAKKHQMAICTLSRNGIKFTVEETKIYQANTFLQDQLFQEYNWNQNNEEQFRFKLNLTFFLDCLNIFGSTGGSGYTALQMVYRGYGHPLVLMLEEGGVVTNCAIKTLDADELTDFNFLGSPITNKVIMDAEGLRDAFSELDWSSPTISLLLSPSEPYFRVSTVSAVGSFEVEYPKDSDLFEHFQCSARQENRYKLALLQPCFKALANASRTQIRTNSQGVLSFQHMLKVEDQIGFVDFFMVPESSHDDDPM